MKPKTYKGVTGRACHRLGKQYQHGHTRSPLSALAKLAHIETYKVVSWDPSHFHAVAIIHPDLHLHVQFLNVASVRYLGAVAVTAQGPQSTR